jgi:hypothetical protein
MSGQRELAVYDGQRLLGYVVESAGRFAATAADGRKLGKFSMLKNAADAVSNADERAVGRARADQKSSVA